MTGSSRKLLFIAKLYGWLIQVGKQKSIRKPLQFHLPSFTDKSIKIGPITVSLRFGSMKQSPCKGNLFLIHKEYIHIDIGKTNKQTTHETANESSNFIFKSSRTFSLWDLAHSLWYTQAWKCHTERM